MTKEYERQFVEAVANSLRRAGFRLPKEIRAYYGVVNGSPQSETEGVIFLDAATVILEIEKKPFPSDTVVKYHRALSLGVLRPPINGGRLILVQAFITRNIAPLRVKNAKYMGELLRRDHGALYISAESEDEDIPSLVSQIEPQLLRCLGTT